VLYYVYESKERDMITTPELTPQEALTLAKARLAELPNLKVSEAKIMFTVVAWFLADIYKLGWEITRARGDEKPTGDVNEAGLP
jgi:hypothetical protein